MIDYQYVNYEYQYEKLTDEEKKLFKKYFLRNLATNYIEHEPEAKDTMRAETCKSDKAAYAMMRKIQDHHKFYRRLRALLSHGFKIESLEGTAFGFANSEKAELWLKKAVDIYSKRDMETITTLDTKVSKLAQILGI